MSIERTSSPQPLPPIQHQTQDLKSRVNSGDAAPEKVSGNTSSTTRIKLTKLVQDIQTDTSQDVDYDRIAKIRNAMEAGKLSLDSYSIAYSLIEDIFQLS